MERVQLSFAKFVDNLGRIYGSWIGWVIWFIAVYIGSIYATSGLLFLVGRSGLMAGLDVTHYALLVRVVLYVVLIALLIGMAIWMRRPLSRQHIGLGRTLMWKDIALGAAGLVIYFLLAMALLALARLIPGFDATQSQALDVGQVYGWARMATFVVLVIITPFAEELLFRGIFYGGLRQRAVEPWAAALIVSAAFGLAHGQLNVGIDVFCLSLVACYVRELTGSIWAGVILHMIKNFIAFAIVFMIGQM